MTTDKEKIGDIIVHRNGHTAYGTASKALYTVTNSKNLFATPEREPVEIETSGATAKAKVVAWGENNNMPIDLIEKVGKSVDMSSNMLFNISTTVAEGVKPMFPFVEGNSKNYYEYDVWKELMLNKIESASDTLKPELQKTLNEVNASWDEIYTFFEENDTYKYLLEQFTDLHYYFNSFPCIGFNKEDGDKRKAVELRSLEASFSRWSEMNDKGKIEWHLYSSKWNKGTPDKKEVTATPALDFHNPVKDLRNRMDDDKAKKWDRRANTFVLQVDFPTPGRNYYAKPYWFSIIESGFYDFAIAIPEIKTALLNNKAIVNYVVEISDQYFPQLFAREKIKGDAKQRERITAEYTKFDNFLLKNENKGKSITVLTYRNEKGEQVPLVKFNAIDNKTEGGDFLADSELASKVLSYGMMVPPSLVGASPGANKSISGSDARELFIIKQAQLTPFRRRGLKPFYVIKAINKWPKCMEFIIPHIELTTLDNNKTGSETKTES